MENAAQNEQSSDGHAKPKKRSDISLERWRESWDEAVKKEQAADSYIARLIKRGSCERADEEQA